MSEEREGIEVRKRERGGDGTRDSRKKVQGSDKYLLTCFGGWIDATEDVEWCSSGPW